MPLPLGATSAGIAFKPQHLASALDDPEPVGFLEVHAENYMGAGGPPQAMLRRLAGRFPLSIHGVGLSLAGAGRPCRRHLDRLADLCRRHGPALVSEHLAWSGLDGTYLGDLLPAPYTRATLRRVADRVDEVQARLGRPILVENPASYLGFADSRMDEAGFLAELAERTGCGILLDVNNLFVSAGNLDFDALAYLDRLPPGRVGEIHLAGHTETREADGRPLLVDTHGAPVAEAVWSLYRAALGRFGPVPTLIERDREVPDWAELRSEAGRAAVMLAAAAVPARQRAA
ncbi:DUF692 domain-containing protein [Stella sp.]|uniref:MNIO family bufferin maturase n=1 Tax=Stella sp. TaxID=2912054 RepID=UPI0035AEB380